MSSERMWWSRAVLKSCVTPKQRVAAALGPVTLDYLASRLQGRAGRAIVEQFGRLALGRSALRAALAAQKSKSPVHRNAPPRSCSIH